MEYELKHWGILGMKWGMRRYQYPDGTLTPAGKVRYQKKLQKESKYEKELLVKNRGTLTDQELKDAIARSESEKKLKDITNANLHPALTEAKSQFSKKATNVLTGAAVAGGMYLLFSFLNNSKPNKTDLLGKSFGGVAKDLHDNTKKD